MKKNILSFLGLLILSAGLIYLITTLFNNVNLGLDLKGGFEVLYEVESIDGNNVTNNMMERTYKTLEKRSNSLGVSEPQIYIEGTDTIRVQLAGVENEEEARNILSSTATLSFRDTNNNLLMTSDVLTNSGAKVSSDSLGNAAVLLTIKDKDKFYSVTNSLKDKTSNLMVIWLDFEEGVDSYDVANCGDAASNCLSAASVTQAFADDVIITGNFTLDYAKNLVDLINSGALPVSLEEISSQTVAAGFGSDALDKTLIASIVGIVLIMFFLICIYRFSGILVSFSILAYTSVVFLMFNLINGVLTLPSIAALVLGIGMAVDANIITLERIKEELKNKKTLKEAFKLGTKRSMSTILDANTTTFIIAIVLFMFGSGIVKGFATMLIINIITTMFIMVFLIRFIMEVFATNKTFDNKLKLFIGYKENNKEIKNYDFVKSRNKFFIFSGIIIVCGGMFFAFSGLNFNVDFSGGTLINITGKFDESKIDENLNNYTIVKKENVNGVYSVRIKEVITKEEIYTINETFKEKYNATTNITVISDIVKKTLIKNAFISLIIAAIAILIYITIRYKFTFAIGALLSLVHDIIMIIVLFSIFKFEVSAIFVAAILTIIGYSINDTIVTFDRIKEQLENSKNSLKDSINDSINITLKRSVLTSITTLIPVISLMFLGTNSLFSFNIALLIGLIFGTYSSIFIAANLFYIFEKKDQQNKKNKPKTSKNKGPQELMIKGINC
ncbi:MAG: protein translocase subunit SecD [Bacilli bacterium]